MFFLECLIVFYTIADHTYASNSDHTVVTNVIEIRILQLKHFVTIYFTYYELSIVFILILTQLLLLTLSSFVSFFFLLKLSSISYSGFPLVSGRQ